MTRMARSSGADFLLNQTDICATQTASLLGFRWGPEDTKARIMKALNTMLEDWQISEKDDRRVGIATNHTQS